MYRQGVRFVVEEAIRSQSRTYIHNEIMYGSYDCTSLVSLDLSNCLRLSTLNEEVFYKCKSLTSVKLPGNLHKIEDYAFGDCQSLSYLDISCQLVTKIEDKAFNGCKEISKIIVSNSYEIQKLIEYAQTLIVYDDYCDEALPED